MNASDEALWRALQPLRSVACWLMTGAHPDDEWSGFLAWLAFGRGVHTVYACATRGEGGQNELGPERGEKLAALRSREMELAAHELELQVRWIGDDDTIFDFGYSKSAEDTLRRWGETRLRDRLVRLIRTERPDALSPTFLDVPGQHGHHRAITRATLQAAEFAADPKFVLPNDSPPPWRVAKIYLPAFSGAGGSYDDREPPPPETVRVDLGATCAELGETWARLGERSRRFHASQGMGRDLSDGPRPFPLHLAAGIPDVLQPMDGLPHTFGELAGTMSDSPAARALYEADEAIANALAAFPDRKGTADALHRAIASLERTVLPAGAEDIARRLHLKRPQLGRAAALALGGADLEKDPSKRPSAAPGHELKIASRTFREPVAIDPGAYVGVIAGVSDDTLGALLQLNINAEPVTDATLASGDLSRFTTLLIGILAFGQRQALRTHRDRLVAWIEAGGSLVTMYHRPGDGWDEGRTPPRRIVIGSPSFHWRVTDPAAPVIVLHPDHPLLTKPNIINPTDWNGWVRERGLYFASEWDPAYQALIETSDPGEPPLRGALLAAPVGAGRHVHVALALHHQFQALIPGAFRLLGNLVARPP